MISKNLPFKGLNSRIPIKIPMRGRGFINQGSGEGLFSTATVGRPSGKCIIAIVLGPQDVRPVSKGIRSG